MTRSDFYNKTDQFFSKYDGKFLDADGAYGNQCVDVVKAFFTEVVGISGKARGNAVDYWNACPELEKIPNTPSYVPQKGDIIVWGTGIGQYGHIAIAKGVGDTNKFDSFDQNFPLGTPCHFVNHSYKNVLGGLRAKNINDPEPVVTPPTPQVDPRDQQIVDLNNQITSIREERNETVKRLMAESANEVLKIEDLSKQLAAANKTINELNDTIDSQKKNLGELEIRKNELMNQVGDLSKSLTDEQKKAICIEYLKNLIGRIFHRG
jgi:uncharacterized coiled-coil protein SlyX